MPKKKLLIIGHAQHGKDSLAQELERFGYRHADSSRTALRVFLFNKLAPKYGYKTYEEAYEDRVNHRAEWYNEIVAFNTPDKTRLAREVMHRSDIYVGMRDRDEIQACIDEGAFDHIIWVDASMRKPLEPWTSFNIGIECADIIVDNNGTPEDLQIAAHTLWTELLS